MKTLTTLVAVFFLSGCTGLETRKNLSPQAIVEHLFVDRLQDQRSFSYFVFWGLPMIEDSLDTPLRTALDNFKAKCERLFPPWGKWDKDDDSEGNLPALFVVHARNDPLTMCATPPAKTKLEKVIGDSASAVYNVTYKLGIDGAIGQYYTAISTVKLVNKSGKWLVADVSNSLYGAPRIETYTFVSRLYFLASVLKANAR